MAAHEDQASDSTTRVEGEEQAGTERAQRAEREDRARVERARREEQERAQRAERRERSRRELEKVRSAVVGLLASIIRWVGLLFAVVLVIYVILVIGEANPSNGITQFVHNWADTVSLGFKNLFTPTDPKLRVLVNYGIAAVFWLVVTSIVAKLLRRLS